jgi:MFS family permease
MAAFVESVRYSFRSLTVRSYRRYFWARAVSAFGTWMQSVAQSWLVLRLTGSGTALGFVLTLQFLPVLVLGPMAGVWVERLDKRRILMATQLALLVLATTLGVLTIAHVATLWVVYALALLYGCATVFTMPAQNVIVLEMVEPELFSNAVSMNLVTFNTARVFGPALAGATIAAVGIGACFLLNALSFLPMIWAVWRIRASDLREMPRPPRARGQLREGIRAVRRTPELLGALVMLLVFGIFAWEFEVSVPLMTKEVFGGDSALYGLLTSAIGVGAIVGTVAAARRPHASNRAQLVAIVATGGAFVGAAGAPVLALEFVALAAAGASLSAWYALITARYQLYLPSEFQARGMALWSTALNGARPVGGPVIGVVGQVVGARATLLVGGLSIFVLAIPLWSRLSRHRVVSTLRGNEEQPHLENAVR